MVNDQMTTVRVKFNELTDALLEMERKHGRSTIDVLRDEVNDTIDREDEDLAEWLDLIELYLANYEIQRRSVIPY